MNRIKISKLLEDVTISLKDSMDNLSDFNLNNERLDQIKEALSIINIFKAQLLSARVDNADLSNLYGMNDNFHPNTKLLVENSPEQK